ncbi:rubredoxin [Flavitalea flava]
MVFRKNHIVRINLPGGIVSAGDLYAITEAAEKAKVTQIQFGTRQQLFCKVADKFGAGLFRDLKEAGISYEVNEDKFPNIVSSYVCENVFEKSDWVSEGLYKDILDGFDFRPGLKVNLVESKQSFVPFFTGNINFISSDIGNYWFLYIRFPRTSLIYQWKDLIYFRDIPRISRVVEEIILHKKELFVDQPTINGDRLYTEVQERESFISQPVTEPLKLPAFNLPYYEGFNRYGNKLWLGIYRREELFPLSFLKDICILCLQTKVGQLYTTPWKSLIIKGIGQEDRSLWDFVLNKHRINVRHASNELNWQAEDLCEEGLRLKRWLVRLFDNDDLRTYGLCFAIKTRPKSGLSGSIIIRKQEGGTPSQRKLLDRYAILYTPDFNANSKEYILFRDGLEKENLYPYLASLCKYFYEQQMTQERIPSLFYRQGQGNPGGRGKRGKEDVPVTSEQPRVFQCRHCLTHYDERYGDPENGEPSGRPFEKTSSGYSCPVCGGGKEGFTAIEKSLLNH